MLTIRNLTKTVGGRTLFEDAKMTINWGERVALVGPNGAGKSVLFKLILGELEPSAGEIRIGPSTNIAYYSQEHQTLNYDNTLVAEIREMKPMYEHEAYNFLGRFLFSRNESQKQIRDLSGGEKSRLQFAKLMLTSANFLLLDEPTTNLDAQGVEWYLALIERFAKDRLVIVASNIEHDYRFCNASINIMDYK